METLEPKHMMYWNEVDAEAKLETVRLEPKHMMYWNKDTEIKDDAGTAWTKTYDVLKFVHKFKNTI